MLDIGSVSLFLGMLRVPHETYFFCLRGAPEDEEVNMEIVCDIIGQQAYNYMVCHYFTRGSMHVVAFYYQGCANCAAFAAALKPRGLASRVVSYLWHLMSSQLDEEPGEEVSHVPSTGGAETGLAAEDDTGENTTGDDQ
ncbi:hypothetical protein M407DRAFT_33845 [Tulasnella calospora MUT 4182]|uniref:Uncharacterized protein n=1 Tax=Tulasnella calospora MUT 4182 TaxID=1051891 RepID=A0A0C3L4H3_9AGAM|nr:hypothetical protein M407DRAFT_33845 [Tulasnella calospora MUT 4182]